MHASLLTFAFLTLLVPQSTQPVDTDALLTVAEKSGYTKTAHYAEVVSLLDAIADASPLVRKTTIGTSGEGRSLPAIIIADPPVRTPEEARQAGKLVVMAIGDIHAGEVCGKAALPILARELIAKPSHPLLNDLVIIFAPIFNADGNERFGTTNRPGQHGPDGGMGERTNAAGLDLNRDFIKLEAPETRGLVEFLNRWDPALFIDTHTTDGSLHRYLVTYETPRTPAGDANVLTFARDTMMPEIREMSATQYSVPTFVYGNFEQDHTRWTTYPSFARYGTSYIGMRNRLSILSEAYAYASFKDRVLGTRDFVKACLQYAAAHTRQIEALLARADADAVAAGRRSGDSAPIAIRTAPAAAPETAKVAGFVEEMRDGKKHSTGQLFDYEVELWTHTAATLSVRRPFAYVFGPELTAIADKLRAHGITVEQLRSPATLDVEAYRVDSVEFAKREFQGHRLPTVEVTATTGISSFPQGLFVVRTAQRLGALAVYLLEPQCEDGLTAWNFFDERLKVGGDFPVYRVCKPQVLDGE